MAIGAAVKSDREMAMDQYPDEFEEEVETVTCDACGGSGVTIEGWDCEECDGLGYWTL